MPALIAVVDDDYSVRRGLTRLLLTSGYTVESFDSGEAFLNRCATSLPACAVLDIHLGDLTGPEVTKELRRCGHSIPVILMTAHAESATRETLADLPEVKCFRKPFSSRILLDEIRSIVENVL